MNFDAARRRGTVVSADDEVAFEHAACGVDAGCRGDPCSIIRDDGRVRIPLERRE